MEFGTPANQIICLIVEDQILKAEEHQQLAAQGLISAAEASRELPNGPLQQGVSDLWDLLIVSIIRM